MPATSRGSVISNAKKCLVTIAAFGSNELTHDLLPDVLAESDLVDVLIIDNGGHYTPLADEWVIDPGGNIGWAAASNMGFRIAFDRGYQYAATLNNDTRLSRGFFAGLLDPRLPADAGLIGSLYDETWWTFQSSDYTGPAKDYPPSDFYREVPMIDGTVLVIERSAWEAVGGLDERSFGKFAWGADIDLAFRMRARGFGVYTTERSFLNHHAQASATEEFGKQRYRFRAHRDCRRAVRRIHGRNTFRGLRKTVPVRRALTAAEPRAAAESTTPASAG